ncbi:MAG: glycosyltransferase family 2 protein [Desulfatiglandales bacterium]
MLNRAIIIIPAYNEEKTISGVLLDLRRAAPGFDRVVVNDGSKDATGSIIESLGEEQITLPCNIGYGPALQTGLKYALRRGYEVIVSFDADGQHDPADVLRVVETLWSKDADLAIGSRYCDGSSYKGPLERRIGQNLFSLLTSLFLGKRVYDTSSGFKALKAGAAEVAIGGTFLDFHIETLVRLSMNGCKIEEVPVTMMARRSGKSMHGVTSIVGYPLKTLLLTLVAAIDVIASRRRK